MGKAKFDISTSLDGFIAGPDDNQEQGLGKGGERLHEWVSSKRVEFNAGGGTLDCKRNEAPFSAFENTGWQQLKGQCSGP